MNQQLIIVNSFKPAPASVTQVGGNQPEELLHENPGFFSLIVGIVGFNFGFTTIVICGSELYTSMCAYMAAAWWENKVSTGKAIWCAT